MPINKNAPIQQPWCCLPLCKHSISFWARFHLSWTSTQNSARDRITPRHAVPFRATIILSSSGFYVILVIASNG